jgi:hypothetical protein
MMRTDFSASSLLDDLKSGDIKIKINAIRSLGIISLTLGKERTRNELLPYIGGNIVYNVRTTRRRG